MRRNDSNRSRCLSPLMAVLWAAVFLLPFNAPAQETPASGASLDSSDGTGPVKPLLLLLFHEKGFSVPVDAEQLAVRAQLAVDAYKVKVDDIDLAAESSGTLPAAFDASPAGAILARHDATVVAWLTQPDGSSTLQLHLLTQDVSLTQEIPTSHEGRETLEADISLVLREGLRELEKRADANSGTAGEETTSSDPETAVASDREPSPSVRDSAGSAEKNRAFAATLGYLTHGDIYGGSGPVTQYGVRAAASWLPLESLAVAITVAPAFRKGSSTMMSTCFGGRFTWAWGSAICGTSVSSAWDPSWISTS